MRQNRVLSMLGLAARGRNVVSGELQTLNAVKDGSAMLVIVAEDASENTRKLFSDKCSFYEVPLRMYGSREALGRAIGKEMRSSLAVIDIGLAQSVMGYLESESGR
ncbi:MAG: ribosomal L7Ae/L30e/S12e/Gadd45 family protein [Lachnospiraceae bacterium]|nr:ribosomal L7Ae/L30e/S12e/Gadd45 family protein [Lachnospiraceae bacterium]